MRDRFGSSIERWSEEFGVPAELVIATICTESGGDPADERREPGFVSYEVTPHRVSIGLMQTLISTAQSALGGLPGIDARWLLEPDNSIRAGTAYIAHQRSRTDFDPPVVACAYNAGGVYRQSGAGTAGGCASTRSAAARTPTGSSSGSTTASGCTSSTAACRR